MIKNLPVKARDVSNVNSIPESGRSPGNPNPVFLPGQSHRLRSLAVYGPWGREELDTTEANYHSDNKGLLRLCVTEFYYLCLVPVFHSGNIPNLQTDKLNYRRIDFSILPTELVAEARLLQNPKVPSHGKLLCLYSLHPR